jgi:hypothetical protein
MATSSVQPSSSTTTHMTETKLEAFAEDLGHLLGEARTKADSWLSQRESIVKHLEGVRDTATQLLQQLGRSAASAAPAAPAVPVRRGGRPAKAEAAPPKRKRFTMSAEAREKIAAAQRARWATVRTAESPSQPAVKRGPGRPRRARTAVGAPRKRSTISAEGRERIAAAQRARWAKLKAGRK